jgi:hypothetical protein
MREMVESQFRRAEELLSELEVEYSHSLTDKKVSFRAKSLTQEYIVILNTILDQVMHEYFEIKIAPLLSLSEREKAKIYFPVAKSKHALVSILGQGKMTKLPVLDPTVFLFIESCQPYSDSSNNWLLDLHKYTNERHVQLTPQRKKEETKINIHSKEGSRIELSNTIVEGGAISLDGKKIYRALASTPESNYIVCDPDLEVTTEIWVNFYFEGTDIEVLKFCKDCLPKSKAIVEKFLEVF